MPQFEYAFQTVWYILTHIQQTQVGQIPRVTSLPADLHHHTNGAYGVRCAVCACLLQPFVLLMGGITFIILFAISKWKKRMRALAEVGK